MDDRDRQHVIERFEGLLQRFGPTSEALGWGKNGKQEIRFDALAASVLEHPESSVLDVGCGFADLFDYLTTRGWHGEYTGVDLVPGLLAQARERHPGIDVRQLDITVEESGLGIYDFVIASGIANTQLPDTDHDAHAEAIVRAMFAHARRLAAIDFLSTWVDFTREGAAHTDPVWALSLARSLTRRVALRHDYLPFEFALFLCRDETITPERAYRNGRC